MATVVIVSKLILGVPYNHGNCCHYVEVGFRCSIQHMATCHCVDDDLMCSVSTKQIACILPPSH